MYKILYKLKAILKFFLKPNRIHIEKFFKANFKSNNPGITGWASKRFTPLRVIHAGVEYLSKPINRPDAPHAFYLDLPNLKEIDTFSVEYKIGQGWAPYCHFVRKTQTPASAPQLLQTTVNQADIKKAVIIHAYYPDILHQLLPLVNNLNSPVDIFVFIPENSPMHEFQKTHPLDKDFFRAIIIGESRGRDMGGFLHLMRHIIKLDIDYDACLILHTKKSPQFPENMANAWRDMLIYPLIGSVQAADRALQFLFSDPGVNLVGSSDFLHHYRLQRGYGNYSRYKQLCQIFDVSLQGTDFIAGTMFWIRFKHFMEFFSEQKLSKAINLLEPGNFPEPSYAHAWERFVGRIATMKNGKIRGIAYESDFDCFF